MILSDANIDTESRTIVVVLPSLVASNHICFVADYLSCLQILLKWKSIDRNFLSFYNLFDHKGQLLYRRWQIKWIFIPPRTKPCSGKWMVEAFLGERGGVTYCVWGARPGVNSPIKHQRKVLIKHQVNSRNSTVQTGWACFIFVQSANEIMLRWASWFFSSTPGGEFNFLVFQSCSLHYSVQCTVQVFKRTLSEILRLPVRCSSCGGVAVPQLTFVSKRNI